MLTLHQLQVFVMVAETGSIRRAAERLVVSQPAVSSTLAALERIVGVDLTAKAGRGIELTEAGRTMERYARILLGLVDEAVEAVRFADDPLSAPVRIGATTAAADHMLPPVLARLRQRRPQLEFTVEVGNRARIWQLLTDRTIDVAISSRPPISGPFESLATRPNDLVLVAKPGAAWPHQIGDVTWLLREPGSSTRAATDEVMAMLAISPPTLTIGSNAAILRAVEAGLGIALLPSDAVAAGIRARTLSLVRADATPVHRPWHVVVRGDGTLPKAARRFVSDLVDGGNGFAWTAPTATDDLADAR